MLKKISVITPLFLLVLGLQSNLYANQNSKSSNVKTQKEIKSQKSQKQTTKQTTKQVNNQIAAKDLKNKNSVTKKVEAQKVVTTKKINNNTKVSSNNKKTVKIVKNKNTKTNYYANNRTNVTLANQDFTSYAYVNNNQKKKVFNDFYNETKHIRYKMGGTGNNGTIDCSAFTQKMFKEKFNYALSRSTVTQVNEGIEVKKSELQPGDLVFFKTSKIDKHVGVYTGNGEFLHASVKGIQYTKLDKQFYKDTYWTARRVIN